MHLQLSCVIKGKLNKKKWKSQKVTDPAWPKKCDKCGSRTVVEGNIKSLFYTWPRDRQYYKDKG